VNDSIVFCGGYRNKEAHVKVIDPHTGVIRIIGAGAWVPHTGHTDHAPNEPCSDDLLNRWNWWHCAGDELGLWVVADNWYGDIVLFDAKTTQMHRLTLGHAGYGRPGKQHPHVGWDRLSKQVVFTSQMLGGVDVCVATIPDRWGPDPATEGLILDKPRLASQTSP